MSSTSNLNTRTVEVKEGAHAYGVLQVIDREVSSGRVPPNALVAVSDPGVFAMKIAAALGIEEKNVDAGGPAKVIFTWSDEVDGERPEDRYGARNDLPKYGEPVHSE